MSISSFKPIGSDPISMQQPKDSPEALKNACKQFEAVFVNMMLKTMRDTLKDEDDMFSSGESQMFTGMLDEKISEKISDNGIGIWQSMYENLSKQMNIDDKTGTTDKKDENGFKINKPILKQIPLTHDTVKPGISLSTDAIDKIIETKSRQYGVDPVLVKAIVKNESAYDQNAVSPVGAKGLMQLMDATAGQLGVKNPFNAEQNIDGGVRYLRSLIDHFGDTATAVAAYNAGPGNVEKYGGIPPFDETQKYTTNVMRDYREMRLKI